MYRSKLNNRILLDYLFNILGKIPSTEQWIELLVSLPELSISCQVIIQHCKNIFPSRGTDTLSWWDGLRGSMILTGYVAGSFYSLLDRPLGESPDQTQSSGPPASPS